MDKSIIVGVDVSKGWLDLAAAGGQVERLDNTSEAITPWRRRVRPALVAFEPTGGYERALQDALREQGIPFVRVHPNEVLAFRKSRGIKTRTDKIDAQLIAAFAAGELIRRGGGGTILGDDELRDLVARRQRTSFWSMRCRRNAAGWPAPAPARSRTAWLRSSALCAPARRPSRPSCSGRSRRSLSWTGSFTCCKACTVSDPSPPWS